MLDDLTKGQCFTFQDIALKVDEIHLDDWGVCTGSMCVRVGVWNDNREKFQYVPEIVAEVTVSELVRFSRGIIPRAVNHVLTQVGGR